jgi:hypothetical protein
VPQTVESIVEKIQVKDILPGSPSIYQPLHELEHEGGFAASVSLQKMMVMIRETKQAARRLLDWAFDDWMELHGHGDKTLEFIFNDLDPSENICLYYDR